MNRADMLRRARDRHEPWDMLIVGGGATGVGVAADAASRGYQVLLVERGDFGVGTSSRSTKLVHGGVRYLRQGHIGLVMEALRERGRLRRNAPDLVHKLPLVLPCYARWEVAYFGVGLTAYDLLAGRSGFGRSRMLSAREVVRRLPTVRTDGLCGGVVYHDGQFDDTQLLIRLLRTAVEHGATVLNYAPVTRLAHGADGATIRDEESGDEWQAAARVVINAAGPFCDDVRRLADPNTEPVLAASQGSHVVLDRSFLPGDHALLVPKTPDGRVLFVIPWHGYTLVGTTDVAIPSVPIEPRPTRAEIEFILETAGRYLSRQPRIEDVLSTWAGVRPLVKAGRRSTAKLSREHLIRVDAGRLVTITGGKWTTYRHMAEECVDVAAKLGGLSRRPCRTKNLHLAGAIAIESATPERLHPALPYHTTDVIRAARFEMAQTVEDMLARRTRALFLNASAAIEMAPRVAALLAQELGRDRVWQEHQIIELVKKARTYLL